MAWCSKTAMEMLSDVVLSDLVSRSVSFLLAKKREKQTTAAAREDLLRRLCHLLLRSSTIVEEAERRHVTNPAMLRQLEFLRDETHRGYYVLDAIRCQAAPRGPDDGRDDDEETPATAAVMRRHAFILSGFNPAKRVRVPSGNPEGGPTTTALRVRELRQAVRSLEDMIGDMKEFVVFLASYPPLRRQPYCSAHLFIDMCMFGRHMEKQRVMEFLLQMEEDPPGAAKRRLGVLPIVGPRHIGKSTLVEHVCRDERVLDHFSLILFYTRNDLKLETEVSFRDDCVIRHRNDEAVGKKLLIVIELLEDLDQDTWNRLLHCSSKGSMPEGSRIIVTSRSEKIARLGTTPALRLKCLPREAYWYFFRTTLFGSEDPGQYPVLASLAMEMANLMHGSFLYPTIGAVVLRENFNARSWRRFLSRTREYMDKNVSLIGEYPDDIKPTKDHPRLFWSLMQERPDKYCMLYDIYERGPKEEVPEMPFSHIVSGCARPRGEYEILFWKSRIPPYLSYVCKCEIRDMS